MAVSPPASTGTRNGSAATAHRVSTHGRRANSTASGTQTTRAATAPAPSATSGRSRAKESCGVFQISMTSSSGVSTSAASTQIARTRVRGATIAAAASPASTTTPSARTKSGAMAVLPAATTVIGAAPIRT